MRKFFLPTMLLLLPIMATATEKTISSPNGKLVVTVSDEGGHATYSVAFEGRQIILPSALGFRSNIGNDNANARQIPAKMLLGNMLGKKSSNGDFTHGLTIKGVKEQLIDKEYDMRQVKQSHMHYVANQLTVTLQNAKNQEMAVVFNVSNNDVAFRYEIPRQANDNPKCAVITKEVTSFLLPDETTTFICPQIDPLKGWERTKPSYEEEYKPDAPMAEASQFGQGYTFPCLFRIDETSATRSGNKGNQNPPSTWVLISETGVGGQYCGAHLSDFKAGQGYTIAYPQAGENNGFGSTTAAIPLPGVTPWRTITVGSSLKPIVETTIAYDVVEPLYEPSEDYKPGRYTWSWLIWQDNSINWKDQVAFIDLAGKMGYEYCLVDGCWDTEIGRDKMAELSKYAQSKGVSLLLWYNSNGAWNDAPQTPRNCMSSHIVRDREMAWLKQIGVKGIKVDFFGGDKQETMRLYEDILYDANRYGLQVIFHGCTLPRGWERMYPNYVSSEAVLASENVYFSDYHARQEPFQLTMHPFCRNAVGTMDWGGVIMNKYMSRDNKSRHQRQTTDVFEMATAFTNQAAVQCIAMQPNNLEDLPQVELDFLRGIPTTWDETRFVDGYPGRYVVLARRHGAHWFVAGLNATSAPLTLQLPLSMFGRGTTVSMLVDQADKRTNDVHTRLDNLKIDKKGMAKVTLQPNGGIIIY